MKKTSSISERQGYVLWALCVLAAVIIWNSAAILFPQGGILAALFILIGLKLCIEAGYAVARRMR